MLRGALPAGLLADPEPFDDLPPDEVPPDRSAAIPAPSARPRPRVAGPGARSLALALIAEATAAGSWAAVVGDPDLGLAAAAEAGVALARLAVVDPPELGSVVIAMLIPMPPLMSSAATVGAAKASWSTKPSASPMITSPATASSPSSESSAGGVAISGIHTDTKMASAPVIDTRTDIGTEVAPKNGAASSAAPSRVIRKTTRHMSCSSAPRPRSSPFTARGLSRRSARFR